MANCERRIAQCRSPIGFTLIEVSVAITLMMLIVATLYGAFYLSQRAVAKSQMRSEESQRLRSAGDLLASYIRSAYPYRPSREAPAIFFSGEGERLTFVSALSSGMGGRGMAQITISWDDEGDGAGRLALEETTPLRPGSGGESGGYSNSVVLAERARELRIEYLDPQSEEESWVDQWDGAEKRVLPRAVRFRYLEQNGAEVQLLFPIMMSVLAS